MLLLIVFWSRRMRREETAGTKLVRIVGATVAERGMLRDGNRVLVCVSGGPDSVCLLDVMRQLAPERRLSLCVAHVDHKTRDGGSTRDAEFVRAVARQCGIPYRQRTLRLRERKRRGESFQISARNARYRYIEEIAGKVDADRIALGHHADDLAETVLMRVITGTGLGGLTGIPAVRGRIIRPLIDVWRDEILDYLDERGLEYRVDRTNLEPTYLRNRLRLDLVPKVESDYNPQFRGALVRLARIAGNVETVVTKAVADCERRTDVCRLGGRVTLDRQKYARQGECVRREMVARIIGDLCGTVEYETVERADEFLIGTDTGKRCPLPGRCEIETVYHRAIIRRVRPRRAVPNQQVTLRVPGVKEVPELGTRFVVRTLNRTKAPSYYARLCTPVRQFFDLGMIHESVLVRRRMPGDRFHPLGAPGEKKLKDYFIDKKVPREERDRALVVLSGGRILWVVGHCLDDRFKLTRSTRRVLTIRCEPIEQSS